MVSESAGPLRPPEQFEGSDVVGARACFLSVGSSEYAEIRNEIDDSESVTSSGTW